MPPLFLACYCYYYRLMRGWSIIMLLSAVFVAIEAKAQIEKPLKLVSFPRESFVLFGASWCAPCRAELRALPELAAAARPYRITIVWIDKAVPELGLPRPATVDLVEGAAAKRMFEAVSSEVVGLPHTLVLTAAGEICGQWPAPLTVTAVERLRAQCLPR
jgi:thiol-disulfide isomerase/thioredoxin